ncbi:MAG: hypothetical protein ACM3U2_20185 [Deltaproteobacteria bacterium]
MNNSDDPEDFDPTDDDPISPEEMAELDRPLHEILGIEPNFAPDDLAPPVDEERLLAFVREQLPAEEREEIICLIASFRPWVRGWAEAMRRSIEEDGFQE